MRLLERDPFAPPVPLVVVEPDPWVRVLAAFDQLRAAIVDAPAPVVQVTSEPVDLGEIVMAVQALKGPATAEDIARALRDVLAPATPDTAMAELLAEVADALKKLDFRMKGVGSQAYGGGSVSFSDTGITQLSSALAAATVDAGDTVTPIVATVTASGDTTVHTPAAGKRVRLVWFSAINDPDESTTPLVKVKFGATELYRVYAVAHRQVFEGATDEPLVVNLDGVASVAVTAHVQEFS